MRERALERFAAPQHPVEMATVQLDADRVALLPGQGRRRRRRAEGHDEGAARRRRRGAAAAGSRLLDRAFIAEAHAGFEALLDDLEATTWDAIERESGLSRAEIEEAAAVYAKAESVIVCYGMGITQHRHGTANVQQIANLLLLRGNIGRAGAGLCPLRGHSNVQGDRTVGITELPSQAFLDGCKRSSASSRRASHGHDAVDALEAMLRGPLKSAHLARRQPRRGHAGPGGPLRGDAAARPHGPHRDKAQPHPSAAPARQALILPCLGRTELDMQAGGPQAVTVEDSMSMVHASRGGLQAGRPSTCARSPRSSPAWQRPRCRTARSTGTPLSPTTSASATRSKRCSRTSRATTTRIKTAGRLPTLHRGAERVWNTPTGKANFIVVTG